MIITCPSCSARYPVDASSFAPSGRKVRCAKCGNTWHQAPPSELGGADAEAVPVVPAAVAQSQQPLFKGVSPAKAKLAEPAGFTSPASLSPATDAENAVPGKDDPFDDDDIVFAPAVSQAAPIAEGTASETPVKLYDISSLQSETGGKLRRYLNDVASMRRGRVVGAIGWVLLVLFVAGTIYSVVQYRREIAAFWPSTAKLYEAAGAPINLVGFELTKVTYERQDENGLPVLAIKGEVVNVSGETKRVPRIRVGLRDENQQELYHWTFALPESELKSAAKAEFTTRLSSPPAGARDLEVRFVEPNEEADEKVAAPTQGAPASAVPAAEAPPSSVEVPAAGEAVHSPAHEGAGADTELPAGVAQH
ncbi:MAG: zinc-ribbon domain-containing protein [Parvibaculaceae bacterium]